MRISRVLGFLLAGAMVSGVLSGCGQSGSGQTQSGASNAGQSNAGQSSTAPASKGKFTAKFAHSQAVESPQHQGVVKFKELAEAKAKEKGYTFEVQIFPAGQLGGTRELTEQTQTGAVEFSQTPVSNLANWATDLNMVGFPYLFTNRDVAYNVLNGPTGMKIMAGLEKEGMKGLGYWPLGGIYVSSSKPIAKVADMKGQKIRVIASPILIEQYKAWGAIPTPMDFGELYNALQQKVVDGQENPLQSINQVKLWEVQKYFVKTDHAFFFYGVATNKKWFDGLPKEMQDVVVQAEAEARNFYKDLLYKSEDGFAKNLTDKGGVIVTLTPEARADWEKVSQPVYSQFFGSEKGKVNKALFDEVAAAVKAAK